MNGEDIAEAIGTAEEIVTDFPTEDVRRWLTNNKDVREEINRRFEDDVRDPGRNRAGSGPSPAHRPVRPRSRGHDAGRQSRTGHRDL